MFLSFLFVGFGILGSGYVDGKFRNEMLRRKNIKVLENKNKKQKAYLVPTIPGSRKLTLNKKRKKER